jgi:3-hexulose-6-phosphate synthase/6-phospho-3-hexuloisomerase
MKMVLQVALDFMNLPRAMRVAEDAVRGGADWVEAGTPLIKSEGLEAVRSLKKAFPDHTVVADLKTMDVGGLETEMAAKAGADVITVLGVADDVTIEEAIKAGRNFGALIMVDMIGVNDKMKRAGEVGALGADYICIHAGIDQQMKGAEPFEELKNMAGAVSIPIAVAGGINPESAPRALENGASIVIVGGAIIKAEEPEVATRAIKMAMKEGRGEKTELYRKYGEDEIRRAFDLVSTPNISDAMHRKGAMHGISPRINMSQTVIYAKRRSVIISGQFNENSHPDHLLLFNAATTNRQ